MFPSLALLLGVLFTSRGCDVDLAAWFPHLTGVFQNSSALSVRMVVNVAKLAPKDIFAIF